MKKNSLIKLGMLSFATASAVLATNNQKIVEAADSIAPVTHIGTYDKSTTFTTSSANGVNPGLFIEVIDKNGNIAQYESEDGVITVPNTRAGAYVTQAKLLGKTMYRDLDTGELLETWEEGRNLELESSQMPVLHTVGENLIGLVTDWEKVVIDNATGVEKTNPNGSRLTSNFIPNPNKDRLWIRSKGNMWNYIYYYDINKNYLGYETNQGMGGDYQFTNTYTVTNNEHYIRVSFGDETAKNSAELYASKVGHSSYEPYNSSIVTSGEEVELRGIGEVQDELNLVTGEITQRLIGIDNLGDYDMPSYTVHNGSNASSSPVLKISFNLPLTVFDTSYNSRDNFPLMCDRIKVRGDENGYSVDRGTYVSTRNGQLFLHLIKDELGLPIDVTITKEHVQNYFKSNPIEVVSKLAQPVIETVDLTTDGYFSPETSAQVSIKGDTVPLIASITVPTETLSFVIDPNQEVDQQFIAPEFSVTNDTYAPLKLEIKSFTQLTSGMNDVLPSKHSDWTTLGKHESHDIALAVVPKAGSGWKSLTEGERYVADNSNYELGVINPAQTVEFSFSALHGPTITKPINLQYTLGLIFDFE